MRIFNLQKLRKQAGNPKVGVWWLINNNIISFTKDIPRGAYATDADSPQDHINVWGMLLRAYPNLRSKDYDNVPRGRVTLRDGRFAILLGQQEFSQGVQNKVMREFSLPANLTDVIVDEHYETQAVDPLFADIMSTDR